MTVAQRQTEREYAAALPIHTVACLYCPLMQFYKYLAIVQADAHTHSNSSNLIVGTIKTLENPVHIILIQAYSCIRNRYLYIIMKRTCLMIISADLNVYLNRTVIMSIFKGI